MFGFISTSIPADTAGKKADAAPRRGLPQLASEAIAIAVMLALLALAFATRMWVYLPHGMR
jgi:hypothetical protein